MKGTQELSGIFLQLPLKSNVISNIKMLIFKNTIFQDPPRGHSPTKLLSLGYVPVSVWCREPRAHIFIALLISYIRFLPHRYILDLPCWPGAWSCVVASLRSPQF